MIGQPGTRKLMDRGLIVDAALPDADGAYAGSGRGIALAPIFRGAGQPQAGTTSIDVAAAQRRQACC